MLDPADRASLRDLLSGLSADAEWLLTAVSVYREPVACDALVGTGAARLECGTGGLSDLIGWCAAAGLMSSDTARRPPTVQVSLGIAADLHDHLARAGRGDAIARAHRGAASYWQWRVAARQQDWQSDVHDLLEARHHLIETEDLRPAETITEGVCSRLHAFDLFAQEEALIRETLSRLPAESPRRAAWVYRLGTACQLQSDYEEAEYWFRQALGGFSRLGDSRGVARCHGNLGALAHARGDYAEAERRYLKSLAEEPAGVAGGVPVLPVAGQPGPVAPALAPERQRPASRPAADGARHDHKLVRSTGFGGRRRILAAVSAVAMVLAVATTMDATGAVHHGAGSSATALSAAATARADAAAWIARWVAKDAIVACDPLMCSALQAAGLPAARILLITSSTTDPLDSDVVAATAAVRSRFSGRLSTVYAPAVIARFGSGSGRIAVRVVAAGGAASYGRALRADLLARQAAGSLLLRNSRISVSAAARRQLAAGKVDSRILITLAVLAALHPLAIIAFGGAGPAASAGMPLLSVDIAAGSGRATRDPGSTLAAIVAFLHAQRPPLLAASVAELRLPTGLAIVRIDFASPSPLGLLGATAAASRSRPPLKRRRSSL